jgi:hypothetical protein
MKLFFSAIALILFLSACKKINSNSGQTVIDVSCQQYVDALGNDLEQVGSCSSPSDSAGFSQQELNLFNSLDTADLTGTVLPSGSYTFAIYPNPFSSHLDIQYLFSGSISGQVVVKNVITDSLLNPVFKSVIRLGSSTPTSVFLNQIMLTIPAGRYRLFQTLSAGSYNNFARRWVNITKTD